jgi:hypothetical protein
MRPSVDAKGREVFASSEELTWPEKIVCGHSDSCDSRASKTCCTPVFTAFYTNSRANALDRLFLAGSRGTTLSQHGASSNLNDLKQANRMTKRDQALATIGSSPSPLGPVIS